MVFHSTWHKIQNPTTVCSALQVLVPFLFLSSLLLSSGQTGLLSDPWTQWVLPPSQPLLMLSHLCLSSLPPSLCLTSTKPSHLCSQLASQNVFPDSKIINLRSYYFLYLLFTDLSLRLLLVYILYVRWFIFSLPSYWIANLVKRKPSLFYTPLYPQHLTEFLTHRSAINIYWMD